jgi:hypothetical protein
LDSRGQTLLHLAVKSGSEETATLLLARARDGFKEFINLLIDNVAETAAKDNFDIVVSSYVPFLGVTSIPACRKNLRAEKLLRFWDLKNQLHKYIPLYLFHYCSLAISLQGYRTRKENITIVVIVLTVLSPALKFI